ncbi:hypothetical protein [Cupriavidus sp. AcVe19-6a]|uniref:hypothetical protein n=1 Tax=Cupriavidus sp. AcVe19-6a TaxID=2821358 RepID=UPI001AE15309|nr:hypothetical protein [Cupriavidus sp. AcVe19-6a]MBP0635524.1 hypothetical protein [Cupriavidus sp. AcVe19-6a]
MSQLPTTEDVALWLTQCKTWVKELATLEAWPPALTADILDRLRGAPAASLEGQAEHFRVRINEARQRAKHRESFERAERPAPERPAPTKPRWRREWEARKAAEILNAKNRRNDHEQSLTRR